MMKSNSLKYLLSRLLEHQSTNQPACQCGCGLALVLIHEDLQWQPIHGTIAVFLLWEHGPQVGDVRDGNSLELLDKDAGLDLSLNVGRECPLRILTRRFVFKFLIPCLGPGNAPAFRKPSNKITGNCFLPNRGGGGLPPNQTIFCFCSQNIYIALKGSTCSET